MPVDADHVIVGAGLSGLLLARALLTPPHPHGDPSRPRVALVDPRTADASHPVTYAWWTAASAGPLDRWRIGSWQSLGVVAADGQRHRMRLQHLTYQAVDWGRARADTLATLTQDRRVTLLPVAAHEVLDSAGGTRAQVRWEGGTLTATWAFDSRPPSLEDLRTAFGARPPTRALGLLQDFSGTWVHAQHDLADPDVATLMDFSATGGSDADLRFSYTLPVSNRRALVMAVRMGAPTEPPALPDPAPAVARLTGGTPYDADGVESGTTPLVVPPPRRRLGRRVLAIGARGGRVRASTGYGVPAVLADTVAVRASLDRHGHPFGLPRDPAYQRALDRVWLRALTTQGASLTPAFVDLLTGAPADSVLRFLGADARPRDVAAVVRALPPRPFLRAAVAVRPEPR